MSYYEIHNTFLTKKHPLIVHYDIVSKKTVPHWHDSVELLYFMKNSGRVILNTVSYDVCPGDLVVVNSNTLHEMEGINDTTEYYCIIVNLDFLKESGLYNENTIINPVIRDLSVQNTLDNIISEFKSKSKLSNTAAIAQTMMLFVKLARNYTESFSETDTTASGKNKMLMIRKALGYIHSNYTQKLSVQEIADNVNFSKDYLCHSFKEITGNTIIYYINLLRCRHAEDLLQREGVSVSQAATESGFDSLSYFTRTYKKFIGSLPSENVTK